MLVGQFNHMALESLTGLSDGKEEVEFTHYVTEDPNQCYVSNCRRSTVVSVRYRTREAGMLPPLKECERLHACRVSSDSAPLSGRVRLLSGTAESGQRFNAG